jgi:hypothetical protein
MARSMMALKTASIERCIQLIGCCPFFARKFRCKLSNGVAGFAARGAPLNCQKSWHSRVISTMQIDDHRLREDAAGCWHRA